MNGAETGGLTHTSLNPRAGHVTPPAVHTVIFSSHMPYSYFYIKMVTVSVQAIINWLRYMTDYMLVLNQSWLSIFFDEHDVIGKEILNNGWD